MSLPVDRYNIGTGVINDIPIYTEFEYTSTDVKDRYLADMQVLQLYYSMTTAEFAAIADKQQAADNIRNALADLVDLAQNGIISQTVAADPATGQQQVLKNFFLTQQMATSLDTLLRTFKAVGAESPAASITAAELEKWKDLSIISPSIGTALVRALGTPGNRSLQSMIELDYVATGNNMINNKLVGLQEKLTTTQQLISTLTSLQQIRNNLVTSKALSDTINAEMPLPPSSLIRYSNVGGASVGPYANNLNQFASPRSLTVEGEALFNRLFAIKGSLQAFKIQLSSQLSVALLTDPNSIYSQIIAVLSDFDELLVYSPAATNGGEGSIGNDYIQVSIGTTDSVGRAQALYTFLTDKNGFWARFNPPGDNKPGDSQSHLTAALTAAQASNDQQKEEVRNALFVFEEFYKSAAAILQRITQILEKMAQNFNR